MEHPSLSDSHKKFLLYMLHKKTVPEITAKEYIANLPDLAETRVEDVVDTINGSISAQNYVIVATACEVSMEKLYIIQNTSVVETLRNNMCHDNANQRRYFFNILSEITVHGPLSMQACVGLNQDIPGLKNNSEICYNLIDKWTAAGYFVQENNSVYIGARAILQFTEMLKRDYPDYVKTCNLCNNAVFHGTQCESCSNVFHKRCLLVLFEKQRTCPNCDSNWTDEDFLAIAPSMIED